LPVFFSFDHIALVFAAIFGKSINIGFMQAAFQSVEVSIGAVGAYQSPDSV
jgi:hypothetical protein